MSRNIVIEGLCAVEEVPTQITEDDPPGNATEEKPNDDKEEKDEEKELQDSLSEETAPKTSSSGEKERMQLDRTSNIVLIENKMYLSAVGTLTEPDNMENLIISNGQLESHQSLTTQDQDLDTEEMTLDTNVSELCPSEGQAVIKLLMNTEDGRECNNLEFVTENKALEIPASVTLSGTPVLPGNVVGQMVQAVTLSDGTTAYIQPPKGRKFIEGQTIFLEDGMTAVIQGSDTSEELESVPDQTSSQSENLVETSVLFPSSQSLTSLTDGQPVQLEDGTKAFLHTTPKEGLQAIQLEDGTTAYLSHPTTEGLFGEASSLEVTPLSLEQLAAQISLPQSSVDQIKVDSQQAVLTDKNVAVSVSNPPAGRVYMGDKAFKCNYEGCDRFYTTQHHLRVHERSHTGDRPFRCEFEGCTKAFATAYGLKSHTRIHTGEKPFKCPEYQCGKAFKTSGDLQKHIRTHTGERPFKCPFEGCERSFTTSNIRKVHIRTHTGERPYTCTEEGCGRAFASATNYKNHIRIHTGEKPYICTVPGCDKRFTEYSSLYKHHVVHTHSKPYVCSYCGKTYRQTSTLAMHKRVTHNDDSAVEADVQLLHQLQGQGDSNEPNAKKAKFEYALSETDGSQGDNCESNQSIINVTEPQQIVLQSTVLTEGTSTSNSDSTSLTLNIQAQNLLTQLQQGQHNMATITVGDAGQQVIVITDPAQLEALQQQLVQQQQTLECTETLDVGSLLNQGTIAIDPVNVSDPGLAGILSATQPDGSNNTFQ